VKRFVPSEFGIDHSEGRLRFHAPVKNAWDDKGDVFEETKKSGIEWTSFPLERHPSVIYLCLRTALETAKPLKRPCTGVWNILLIPRIGLVTKVTKHENG